jgi:outer membrane protein OmpA-like peptidoglycan-associated protein
VSIDVQSASPIYSWHIEIREPEPPYLLFAEWDGEGEVPPSLTWDGHSPAGNMVESATEYFFMMRATNIYNESATYEGKISIDVLVLREAGDILRVIVPSIVFAPNAANFRGLSPEIVANNERILRRIAEVLNTFGTYRVKVEGHANPTTPPRTNQRTQEERGDRRVLGLQPLSEDRAKAVVEYLVNMGVSRSRLTAVGMGGTRTRFEFADRDNWWKNRRVEFILER